MEKDLGSSLFLISRPHMMIKGTKTDGVKLPSIPYLAKYIKFKD